MCCGRRRFDQACRKSLLTYIAKRIKADRGLPADGAWSVNLGALVKSASAPTGCAAQGGSGTDFLIGESRSGAAVVACDEPTEAVGNSRRNTDLHSMQPLPAWAGCHCMPTCCWEGAAALATRGRPAFFIAGWVPGPWRSEGRNGGIHDRAYVPPRP
jgi:hypothetical protein